MYDEDDPDYCPTCDEPIDEDGCCLCADDYCDNDNFRMWDGEQYI